MEAVDQLVVGRRRLRDDAEPAERIDPVVFRKRAGRKARPADAVEAVAAGDDVAIDLLRFAAVLPLSNGVMTVNREYTCIHIGQRQDCCYFFISVGIGYYNVVYSNGRIIFDIRKRLIEICR